MAFGFTPKFEQSLDINGLDPPKYLAIAQAAVKQLGWEINYISKSGIIAFIGGGIFSSLEEFKLIIHIDTVDIKSSQLSNGMYDWGRNKKHVEEFMQVFDEIQTSTTDAKLDEMLAELAPVLDSIEEDKLALPSPTAIDNIKSFFSLLVPRNGYYVSPIIIDINILLFTIMALSGVSIIEPGNVSLVAWGANFGEFTLEGQWWRLFTCIFLHIGIFHLLFNMYALLYIGLLLEPYLGKLRFAAAYLFTGIIASLTSTYWHPLQISAGASGAIFGMYGIFLAMLTTNIIDKTTRKALLVSIGIFVFYNLMNGLKVGIDNAAHIGGLLSGLIIGYAYYPSLKNPSEHNLKYLTIGVLTIAFVSASFFIYKQIPNDIVKYDAKLRLFSEQEEDALWIYKEPKNSTNATLLSLLDAGTINWNKNLKLLHEMDQLNVPVELLVRDNKLRTYCKLRIKSYEFIKKSINENDSLYADSIKSYNKQIQAVIDDLKGK